MWIYLTRNGLVNIPYTPETLYIAEKAWVLVSIHPQQTFKVIPTPHPKDEPQGDPECDVTQEAEYDADVVQHERH